MNVVDYDQSKTKLIKAHELRKNYHLALIIEGDVEIVDIFNWGDEVQVYYYSNIKPGVLKSIRYPIESDVEVLTTGDGF